MSEPVDPSGLAAESNAFRYRPLARVALCGPGAHPGLLVEARRAAAAVGVEVVEVVDPAERLDVDKVRILGPLTDGQRRSAHRAGLWVDDTPVAADTGREVLRWVREQAVSESRHRHGNVTARRPGLGRSR